MRGAPRPSPTAGCAEARRARGAAWARLAFVLIASAVAGSGCRGCGAPPADVVVARADGLELRADDVALAVAAARGPGRPPLDPAALRALVETMMVDEALAREAGTTVPGAAARAAFAGREAAVRLLVDGASAPRGDVESHYEANRREYTRPAEVQLSEIVFATCDDAHRVKEELRQGKLSFAAAALRDSRDRKSGVRGGELGWLTERQIPRTARRVVAEAEIGAVAGPVDPGGSPPGCRLYQVRGRKPETRHSLDAVRGQIERTLDLRRRAAARQALLQRLTAVDAGSGDGGSPDPGARSAALLRALWAADGGVADDVAVARLGIDRITAGEVRAELGAARGFGPGGAAGLARRLRQDLVLFREARRLGLDQRAEVRAAVRLALVAALRAADEAQAAAASQPAAAVRAAYERTQGDYTEPRRVRVSAMVTRDRKKADRWLKQLRAARFPTDEFDRLVAKESEDTAAARSGGDLGWIDERSSTASEALKGAALKLRHPGDIAGVIPASGAYHVLLCRDLKPARVRPLEEVAAEVAARLGKAQRGARFAARVAAIKARLRVDIVPGALERFVTPPGPSR